MTIISLLVSGHIVDQYYVCLSSLMSMETDSQCDVWRNSKQACSVHCFIDFSVHPGGSKQPHFRWCTHHTAITGDILRVNAALLEVSSDAATTAFWVMRPIKYFDLDTQSGEIDMSHAQHVNDLAGYSMTCNIKKFELLFLSLVSLQIETEIFFKKNSLVIVFLYANPVLLHWRKDDKQVIYWS